MAAFICSRSKIGVMGYLYLKNASIHRDTTFVVRTGDGWKLELSSVERVSMIG